MQLRMLICLFLCTAVALNAYAESAPPDPARLTADWWSYFAPADPLSEEELAKRVSETSDLLGKIPGGLGEDRRAEILPAVARLQEQLGGYPADREQEAKLGEALPPPQETYSLEQAFSRNEKLIQLNESIASQQDEISWQKDLLVAERKQQSRKKVAYLDMADTDPTRLEAGLALMLSRVEIEREGLELERRKATLARLQTLQATLQKEVADIADRLKMTQGEIVDWERVKDIALSEAASFRDDEAISSSNPITDASAASFQSRVDTLRILDRDLRVKRTELIAARAEAIAELIRFTTSDGSSADQLRSLAKANQELVEGLAPRRKYWKNAVARIQDALGRGDAADGKIDQGAESGAQKLIRSVQKTNASVDLESRQLAFAAQLVEQRLRAKESAVARSLTGTIELARSGLESASTLLSTSLFEINETPVTPFGLLRVVVFITVAWLLSKAVQRGLRRLAARRTAVNQSSLYTLGRISHYVILTLGLIIGLSSIGIDFTKFALLASALGVGIGFGMQALVSNFVAGLIILFEKSLKVGDFVELQSGVTGEVKEINMRATLLTTNDNVDILVPNSEFINKEVTNWTLREAHRRIHVSFGVAYGTNKELVEKAVLEAADAVRWTLKDNQRQNPQVWFVNFGDSSLDFELVVWLKPEAVKRPGAVQAAYLWAIETKLGEYGIEVPFPQRDLHLRSGFDAFLRQRAAEAEAAPAGTGTGG